MARGRLRVYLGAAPGVGKTFAMLNEGRRRAERGTDVVVGFVETHGRPNTERADRRPRGRPPPGARVPGHDVRGDGRRRDPRAQARRRCSSTSSRTRTCPGSRNEKRWQDVEEILDAGIDVISTVNIQHLESLNDVVKQITGVEQRETIPDEVVRRAEQIELVDQTPGGAAPAHGARQHLRAGEGRRRARRTTSGSATSARCASSRSCGPPTGSTRRSRSTARRTASPGRGRRASG